MYYLNQLHLYFLNKICHKDVINETWIYPENSKIKYRNLIKKKVIKYNGYVHIISVHDPESLKYFLDGRVAYCLKSSVENQKTMKSIC